MALSLEVGDLLPHPPPAVVLVALEGQVWGDVVQHFSAAVCGANRNMSLVFLQPLIAKTEEVGNERQE